LPSLFYLLPNSGKIVEGYIEAYICTQKIFSVTTGAKEKVDGQTESL
jgi:hypothetical protein